MTLLPNAVALNKTFNPAMCEVGSSSDQLSPGVAPKYLWLALVDAINAELDSATDFAKEVEPDVFTTSVIALSIFVIGSAPVESAGPDPSRAAAKFS